MKGPLELHSPVHGALCATVHGATKSRIGPSDCIATTTCQRGAERRAKLTGPGTVRTPDYSSCSTVPHTPRLLCTTKSSLQGSGINWGPVGWESGCLMGDSRSFGANEFVPKEVLWSLACKRSEEHTV